ncbi:unnamed protein product [Amoebophrya sp. A25]|nr:unnamed protein product [Amoebophrya sp. A25]|eukprot:GSA25T00021780001.1
MNYPSSCRAPGRLVDYDTFFRAFPWIDLLHMNCEGCEYGFVQHVLGHNITLTNIDRMALSFHFYLFDKTAGGYWPYAPGIAASLFCDFLLHVQKTHIVEFRWDGWYLILRRRGHRRWARSQYVEQGKLGVEQEEPAALKHLLADSRTSRDWPISGGAEWCKS